MRLCEIDGLNGLIYEEGDKLISSSLRYKTLLHKVSTLKTILQESEKT